MGVGRVLIVEDEAMVTLLLEDIIAEASGTVVGIADTVAMGMALIAENNHDLVILDVNLQGETSEALADILRERGDTVLVTSGSHPGELPAAYNGFEIAQKPFHMMTIIDKVRALAF